MSGIQGLTEVQVEVDRARATLKLFLEEPGYLGKALLEEVVAVE